MKTEEQTKQKVNVCYVADLRDKFYYSKKVDFRNIPQIGGHFVPTVKNKNDVILMRVYDIQTFEIGLYSIFCSKGNEFDPNLLLKNGWEK